MWRDEAYLLDILLAARKITRFTHDYDSEKFAANEILQHGFSNMRN